MNANGMDAAARLIIMSDSEIHHEAHSDEVILQKIKIVSPDFIGITMTIPKNYSSSSSS